MTRSDNRRQAREVSEPRDGRKAYRPPGLTPLGRLHVRTQGTGNGTRDLAGGRYVPGQAMMNMMCDRRAKENVVKLGPLVRGLDLYLFDYRPEFRAAFGHGRRIGLMADEVLRVVPEAVVQDARGYLRVDWTKLDAVVPASWP